MARLPILIAPAAFKGTISALSFSTILLEELKSLFSLCPKDMRIFPIADGGDDTLEVVMYSSNAWNEVSIMVTGPLPKQRREATYLFSRAKRTVLIESAQANGLVHLPDESKPSSETARGATSYGVGELLLDAIQGIEALSGQEDSENASWTVVVALGGSASTDGGKGALVALSGVPIQELDMGVGFPFYDLISKEARSKICCFFEQNKLLIATDVDNPLLGSFGAAEVYSPQKGACGADVIFLENRLRDFVTRLEELDLPFDITEKSKAAGAGAAGGLAFALSLLPNSQLVSGAGWVFEHLNVKEHISKSSCIITGEGCLDAQSFYGKATGRLLDLAISENKPVLFVCGSVSPETVIPERIKPYVTVLPIAVSESERVFSMLNPEQTLRHALKRAFKEGQLDAFCNGFG